MKHKQLCLSICITIILSMIIGSTTSYAQPKHELEGRRSLSASMSSKQVIATLPRDETLYFNGEQWGSVTCWNPYSSNCNNSMAIAQADNARITVFETPYIYNMLTGEQSPLLADGPYTWNEERTQITFKIKSAAHWSDGTPVTAEDVAYTWATNINYQTLAAINFQDFIENITALDSATVQVTASANEAGKAVNPLMVEAYLSTNYVTQKAWTQALEERSNGDADAFINDPAYDFVSSGPYLYYFDNDQIVVLVRDDNYWGQDSSMWGELPVPKYLAHVIYPDNDSSLAAFKMGEVDVSQMFIPNVQELWLDEGLPVSTYLPDAPYQVGASLPTAFYNLSSYGLDNPTVRQAIAMAVDYNAIVADAMTNQSATFEQVPRSLMNPTPGEQDLYDHNAVENLQWAGNDIQGAIDLLNDAGIIDSDGNGWREIDGQTLAYSATCPGGWTDWEAAAQLIADAGQEIGIKITTNFPDWEIYQNIVTNWSALTSTEGYDIFMMWSDGAGPTQPWGRIRHLISSEYANTDANWNGNWGGYSNPAADAIIQAIPWETDPAMLKEEYTELTEIYLTDIPSFTVMYRPQDFYTVNELVWTGFPHQDDGSNPRIPPLDLIDGYSIAGLYRIEPKYPRNQTLYLADLQWEAPTTFNPLDGSAAWPVSANYLLTYETLFAYNQLTGTLDPLLAKKLKTINPTAIQVTLQDSTRWQDGQPLTPDDVVYSFMYAGSQPGNNYSSVFDYISEIIPTGDRTLRITLNPDNLNPGMVNYLLSTVKILPMHIWQPRGDGIYGYPENNPIGSGPFKLYETSALQIALVRDDTYWGKAIFGLPKPKYVVHTIYSSSDVAYRAFLNGDVDLISTMLNPQFQEIPKNIGTWYTTTPYQYPGSIPMLMINTSKPGLDNPLVRRALAFAIDYPTIAATAMYQPSTTVNSSLILPVGPERALFSSAQVATYGWTFNPDKSREFLENQLHAQKGEDGIYVLPDGTRLGPWVASTVCGWLDWQSALDQVSQSAQAAGFDIEVACADWGTSYSALQASDFDLTLWYITGSTASTPWARFRDMLGEGNYGRYSNPAVAALLYQAGQASNPTLVKSIYNQLDKIFMQDAVGIPLMYRPYEFYAFNSTQWKGFPTSDDASAPPMFSGAGVELLYQIRSIK